MEARHAGYFWQILKPKVQILDHDGWDRSSDKAFERSWYTEQITEAEYQERLARSTVHIPRPETEAEKKLLTAIFSNEVSTPKEHKAMSTFNVSFTATKTVRQQVEATVEIEEDDIREQLADELKQAQIEVDGSTASITLEVDLEDMVRNAVANGDYDNLEITDADLDGDDEFDDIDDIEISS
jgi:hypothetical protein